MPVLVVGAESQLGARVIEQLRPSGGEVRAYLDATVATDDEAVRLRALGCKVALGELDDEGLLERALEQVHTVAHCWTGPLHDPIAQVEVAATVGSALLGAGVRRLIWVCELARDERNPYLAAVAQIRELFSALPVETVTFATGLRLGSDDRFTARLRDGWLCGSAVDPTAAHAPVSIDDVASAVAAADRQRGSRAELHLELALVGPEQVALEALLRRLGAPPLDAPRPPQLAPPDDWIVDWLSRPAADDAARDGMTLAHGVNRLTGV